MDTSKSNEEIYICNEQEVIYLRAVDPAGDPTELTLDDARALVRRLQALIAEMKKGRAGLNESGQRNVVRRGTQKLCMIASDHGELSRSNIAKHGGVRGYSGPCHPPHLLIH